MSKGGDMKKTILLLLCIYLSGCYTNKITENNTKLVSPQRLYSFQKEDDSNIMIIRDSGAFFYLCTVDFYIDGILAAGFKPSERAKFYITAGDHNLSIRSCGEPNTIHVSLNKGETKKYRIYIGGASFKLIPL